MGQYIAFADQRFIGFAKNELLDLFSSYQYSESSMVNQNDMFVFEVSSNQETTLSLVRAKELVFVDNIIPLLGILEKTDADYKNIIQVIAKSLSSGKTFKIEVKNVWSHLGEHAKDIEVKIGKSLEEQGFTVDLVDPDEFIYVVILDGRPIIGKLNKEDSTRHIVDDFRFTNILKDETISRAAFKLSEAVEYFNINTDKLKSALDIGAAPGGWVSYLAKKGIRTVAIDSAFLDYPKLIKNNKIVVASESADKINGIDSVGMDKIAEVQSKYNIVHIRNRAQNIDIELLKSIGPFDILLIDINIPAKATAEIAASLSVLLKSKSPLIMTIKLVDDNVYKHINDAKSTLEANYSEIKVKKLTHNRMELTCFAIKK